MKNINDYILEYKGIALHNSRKSIGDPDGITHKYKEGVIELDYASDYGTPYAFIFNKKNNNILFSFSFGTHREIFDDYKDTEEGTKIGLDIINDTHDLRYTGRFYDGYDWQTKTDMKAKDEMKKWYEENKEKLKVLTEGRIWYIENIMWVLQRYNEDWADANQITINKLQSIAENKNVKAYIAFWNDIPGSKFKEYCDSVVKQFSDKHGVKIEEYIAVGNNGESIVMNINDKSPIKVKQRTKNRQEEIDHVWQYHADITEKGRKRRRELMKGYIKARGEHFQREYYNKTKSKTAAEWHNNKTKRYNRKTGKMEWGEKIGDSLIDYTEII